MSEIEPAGCRRGSYGRMGQLSFVAVQFLLGLWGAAPLVAMAQTPAESALPKIEEIVVVGSRIKSEGPVVTGALPLEVISSDAIKGSGVQSTDELLHYDPSFTGLASGDNNGNEFTYLTYAQLNLWGLGPQYTLVMMNGVRFEADAPANFSIIPPNAIERIEVLRAGAGPIYGSDAVAGVVNIVTKRSSDETRLNASYGQVSSGSAPITTVDFSTGGHGDAGEFFVSASYYDRKPLDALERDVISSNDFTKFGFGDFRSSFNDPAKIYLPGSPDPIFLNQNLVPNGQYPTSPADFRPYNAGTDLHDRPSAGITAIGGLERGSFYVGATHPVGSGEVFVNGIYARERVNVMTGSTTVDLSTIGGVPASNPWNVFHVGITTPFLWRPLDMPGPDPERTGLTGERDIVTRDTGRFTFGLRQTFGKVQMELAANYFGLVVDDQIPTSISTQGLIAALHRTDSTAFNPFCVCNTAAQYAGVQVTTDQTTTYRSPSVNLNFTGPAFTLPTGDVEFSAGGEYRRESVSLYADPMLATGGIAGVAAVPPYDLHRSEQAGYGEVRIPLLGAPAAGGRPTLELGAAVRYEHYSDFGSATKPLFSLRWDAIPETLTLRASYSQSFLAPRLEQLTSSPNTVSSQLFQNGAPVTAVIIQSGNPNLRPETANTVSVGAIFSPNFIPNLRMSLDYFNVRQKNLIVSPDPQAVVDGTQPGTVVQNSANSITVYTPLANLTTRRMQAMAFEAKYAVPLPRGWTAGFGLNSTYLLKMMAETTDGTGEQEYAGRYSSLFGGLPKFRSTLTATANHGGFTGGLRVYYVGHYMDDYVNWSFVDKLPPRLPTYATTDITARYDFGKLLSHTFPGNLGVDAGIKNVFNRSAPFVAGALANDSGVADLYGRFFHAGVSLSF